MTPEFKSFSEIKALSKMQMYITQKIHGSNAQIFVYEKRTMVRTVSSDAKPEDFAAEFPGKTIEIAPYGEDSSTLALYFKELDLVCGSRNRWIYPHSDNYGFATFIDQHKDEYIAKLGEGRHDCEWAGPGINSGEGLAQKTVVLFDHWRYKDKPLPTGAVIVPVLYAGDLDLAKVQETMDLLKIEGSRLAPGFMRPEGVVVSFAGHRYKKVFKEEKTAWSKGGDNKGKNPKTVIDFNHLCQPVRLEKLLSRDESYKVGFPENLPTIVKAYVADLVKEEQIRGDDEGRAIQKAASGQIFRFVKTFIETGEQT